MSTALLFLPALVGIAFVVLRAGRRPRVLAAAAPPPPTPSGWPASDPLAALEALLAELERATLDERGVAGLEALADELEAAARRLERVG